MEQPVSTSIEYLGKRTGLPQHCRVRADACGDEFILHVDRPDDSRWWRNFFSCWPVTVVQDGHVVHGTGLVTCRGDEEVVVTVTRAGERSRTVV